MNDTSNLGIAAVERDTGLSKDTLRVWERRYGFPKPLRDSAGERVYPAADVTKLRLIKRLIDQGYRPAKLVGETPEALAKLLDGHAVASGSPVESADERTAILQLLRLHRSDDLRALLAQTLMKLGLQRFVVEIVAPLNQQVGQAWLRGEIEVTEEHLYTELVQNTLRGAINTYTVRGVHPKILLTTFPDEEHSLGLLMVEAMLVPEGAQCVSLGVQTPLPSIRHAVESGGFDIVALSFSSAYPMRQAVDGLLALRRQLPDAVTIWAGGAGVRGRQRNLPDIHLIAGIGETLSALRDWRNARLNS